MTADPALPLCTCFAVRRAARHVTQAYDGHLARIGLRTTQYSLLNALAGAGPRSLAVVARQMGLDRTTLGRNLRPLERDGLVSIGIDPQDRRGRALSITPLGREKLAEGRACWVEAQAEFESLYGPERTRDLHATLGAVATLAFGTR